LAQAALFLLSDSYQADEEVEEAVEGVFEALERRVDLADLSEPARGT